MLYLTNLFIAILLPFVFFSTLALLAMLVFLILQRGTDELQFQRRKRLTAHYRSAVDVLLGPDPPDNALIALARAPTRHRPVIETMLLKPLALATGTVVERLRSAARVTKLLDVWADNLTNRRWWVRADAARALGLVREARALPLIFRALDDDHEEVRAAAVEALGLIGHPQAIPVLLARLPDQSRNQRARIVEALREFGDAATPALVEHARTRREDGALVADILGLIGGHIAAEELKRWITYDNADIRRAALRALGTIGLDESSTNLALSALEDPDANVRAMAARALGRARRHDTASALARHLDDEWMVAANSADALRRMGRPGLELLQARVDDKGYPGDLARQMLWERRSIAVGA